jgi:hypothetical protein
MSDQHPPSEWKGSSRGEAAWRETRDAVAARNDAVRKSGKQQREADERAREDARIAAERRRHAAIVDRGRGR